MTALRLRWWEALLLALPTLLVALFLVAGQVVAGIVLLALVLVVAASRAQVRERHIAGGYAHARAWIETLKWIALFAIYIVIVVLFFVIQRHHWTRQTPGEIALYALVGLSFFLVREALRLSESANRWFQGAETETAVARELDKLRDAGWLITHDIEKRSGGNLDHFASGPNGAFAIETKSGRPRAADRAQAVANAVWAKEKFGLRWVTAVLCVGTDPPDKPQQHGYVWIVGVKDVAGFLASMRR